MIPQIKCPDCNSTEVYRISRLVIPEPEGRETVYVDYSLAHSEDWRVSIRTFCKDEINGI